MATIRPSISVQCLYLERGFCPFGFPLKHTIAAYAFRFYLENGIVFKRSFGAFGGSILRTCHFCLRYCIHCTVVAWAEYTLYLELFFRFFGFGLCNCMISVYTQTLSTYCSYPLHLFFRNKREGGILIFAFLEILPPPAMHACPLPFVFDEYAAPHHSLTCFVAAHISNL